MRILYVSDLDGTLLNTKDAISPYSIDVINRLAEAGMLFTYATARSLSSASVVTKGLNSRIPVIAYNGAFLFEPETGKILATEGFTEEERHCVREVLTEYGISPVVYSFIGEKSELEQIYGIFSKDQRYTCTLQQELYRPEYWCEIMPRKATKYDAILKLKELLHCDRVAKWLEMNYNEICLVNN
jgi:hypothetical protein